MTCNRLWALCGLSMWMLAMAAGCGQPTVSAGQDQTVSEGSSVTLQAIASTPGSTGAPAYVWEQLSGTSVTLVDPTRSNTSFTAPDVQEETELEFQITMVATVGSLRITSVDTVSVVVQPNPTPSANAGADATVTEGSKVDLQGQGTISADGVTLTYLWTQVSGPTVNISNADFASASFTAPAVDSTTQLQLVLTVKADSNNSATDSVVITVEPELPEAAAGEDQVVTESEVVNLDASQSTDPDDGVLSFQWEQQTGPEVSLSSDITAEPFFTAPDVDEPTLIRFQVTVTSEDGATDLDTVDITVVPFDPPSAIVTGDNSAYETQTVNLTGMTSIDPAGGALTYAWEVIEGGVTLASATSANTSFTAPTFSGDTNFLVTLRLTVTNEAGESDSANYNVTVMPYPAPVANAGADQSANESTTVTLDGTGSSDPVGGDLTFEWSEPVTLSSDSASKPTFVAPSVSDTTAYTFTLTVTNALGETDTDTVVVHVLNTD